MSKPVHRSAMTSRDRTHRSQASAEFEAAREKRPASYVRSEYVSKTDMYAYRNCPYTFHLVETGQISRDDAFSIISTTLMEDGIAFEDGLLAEMPATSQRFDDPKVLEKTDYLFGVETITDHERKLIGRPDGIDLRAHAPIEIKHRLEPTAMDRLELAFYWKLLEPFRTNKDVAPYGLLETMSGSLLWIPLSPSHFKKVDELIAGVLRARRDGVRPLPCRCFVCLDRPEVQAVFDEMSDVGMIIGIKSARAEALRSVGVGSVTEFAAADPVELAKLTKAAPGVTLSAKFIVEAQSHARALRDKAPVWVTDDRLEHDGFIAIDLEYISGLATYWGGGRSATEIFMVGALLQQGDEQKLFQTICYDRDDLKRALNDLAKLIRKHETLPIYTWNGESADLPYLERAARRHRVSIMTALKKRHIDLFRFARRVVRLPIVSHELKSVGGFLNIDRAGDLSNGFAAVGLFHELCATRGKKKRQVIADQLMRYNGNDLRALAAAAAFFHTREHPTGVAAATA
jgi:predicted RecB family nuclease